MSIKKKLLKKINFLFLKILFYLKNSRKNNFYNSTKLNLSIIEKTKKFNKDDLNNYKNLNYYRTLKFLKFIKNKNIKSIIDFGGGAGYHYLIARKNGFNFKWSIIENHKMVILCKKKIKYKNLSFYNNLNNIKNHDIFFSSCAINYLSNAEKILKKISNKKFKYLYFTRTPLSENIRISFKQFSLLSDNGPAKIEREKDEIICNKNYILPITKFESFFKQNFILTKKYIDEKKAFYAKGKYYNTYTYIFKKKS